MLQQFTVPDPPCCDGCETTPHIPKGTKGAISEYLAVADLLRRGHYVFRSVSPNCPWDLVVSTPSGRLVRVEVKSGVIDQGKLYAPMPKPDRGHDVVCYVTPEGVIYDPPITAW